ncbi:hypothetical protein C3L33_05200, partial [Rhododendron williamsianum]
MSVTTDEEIAKLEITTKLFRIRRTTLEMLKDRGYMVDKKEMKMTKQEFIDKFGMSPKREELIIQTQKGDESDDPSDRIFVIFPEVSKKVGCSVMKECVLKMDTEKVSRAILVIQHGLTPQAKAVIGEVAKKYRMETFQDSELLVNINEHELVPKHEVLTSKEENELLEKYKVKRAQLPRMLVTDPIARYFGLKMGQIVKITRKSETAGTYITYRCVF